MIKQFIPQEVCLGCQGCCRFKEQDSVWSPCLLDEEIQAFLDKNIPPLCLSLDKKVMPIPNPQGEGYICSFFDIQDNKCKIYEFRPLECQLYPFLISLRNKKALLTVDLNCPYIKEKINSREFKEYTDYLTNFLNSPKQSELLKDNPHIIRAYEEVLDVIELNI